jgi:hypothetical protein
MAGNGCGITLRAIGMGATAAIAPGVVAVALRQSACCRALDGVLGVRSSPTNSVIGAGSSIIMSSSESVVPAVGTTATPSDSLLVSELAGEIANDVDFNNACCET